MSVITPEEIKLIPLRYRIGKRPLSLVLGWGELTYTRLLDGNTPTAAHAAELRNLLDDPVSYVRVLETGRDRITEAAYNRSFAAVDEILADQGGAVRASRIFVVADRFCKLAEGDLTPSALQRLVYYAQGFCFAKHDSALFDELPFASAFGPEYSRITNTYTYDEIQTTSVREVDDSILSDKEKRMIDLVYGEYGLYSGQALSKMSREEGPWKKTRKRADVSDDDDCADEISVKSMKKFFSKVKI